MEKEKGILTAFFILLFAFVIVASVYSRLGGRGENQLAQEARAEKEAEIAAEEAVLEERRAKIQEAERLAQGYDYDAAVELLKTEKDYETDSELINAIAKYTAARTKLVPVEVSEVPHIFFHSLIVDTERAFDTARLGESRVAGINAWMTTVEEFDQIISEMYENGYVLVRMRDLVTETKKEDGTVQITKNTRLLLPEGKKAYVLSVDDWSYYHSYDGQGFAEKAVLDENGAVKCQYTDASGNTSVGDYDVVPRLESFLAAHPDAAYRGARGMLAMTGYNGVFGYRTDAAYRTRENLGADQAAWLSAHPEFDYDAEAAEATKIAEALKEAGWEFACHTWGHLSVTGKDVETLRVDQEKWQKTVGNIVGPTDTIIFAHGNDIGSWRDYDASTNPVYAYFKSAGYHFYANVDASTKHWIQIREDYFRQGRIDCDGVQMYRAKTGEAKTNVFEDLFDVHAVFDERRPTPVTASGKA